MHLLQDENGNPIPHGHDGGDCHVHEHCEVKEGGTCPAHEHHHHHHEPPKPQTKEQAAALLDYMSKHNESHAAELDKLTASLNELGLSAVAEQVKKSVDEYTKGNLYLNLALSMIKEA